MALFINKEKLGVETDFRADYTAYSGTDIVAALYMPSLTKKTVENVPSKKFKVFANLQTLSVSSTRSISPVRVLGSSSPIAFTRGGRTVAGTMVFAALTRDAFTDVYDESITESYTNSLKLFTPDQLPPFSIIITMTAEKGGTAYQIINGITLVNYGTTYSIDDLYTEVVYTYVATECTPLISTQEARISDIYSRIHRTQQAGLTPSIDEYLYKLYANSFPGASRDKLTELININIANEINDRNS